MNAKLKRLKDRVRGVIHLVMTPFDSNGELDEAALRTAVEHAADALAGEDAVFLTTASTGEFYAMSDDECKTVIRVTVEQLNKRFPVFVGTGRSGTRQTIELSRFAQDVGADGVMLLNPYYQPVTEEGLYRHFKAIAESIDVGIMIYNNPVMTKLWIPPELMARLSKIDNIIADKETITDAARFYRMTRAVDPADMAIICGIGQTVWPCFAVYGCPGFVTELANFAPQVAIDLYRSAKQKDFDRLVALLDRLEPYHLFRAEVVRKRSTIPTVASSFVSSGDFIVAHTVIKEAMNLVGLPGGTVREPAERLTPDEITQLKAVLRRIGVL